MLRSRRGALNALPLLTLAVVGSFPVLHVISHACQGTPKASGSQCMICQTLSAADVPPDADDTTACASVPETPGQHMRETWIARPRHFHASAPTRGPPLSV